MPREARIVWVAAVLGGAVASCGSRTGLFGEGAGVGTTTSGGPGGVTEAGIDTGVDGDTGLDVIPPIDVMPKPDVDRTDCPDADATFIYVVTEQQELFSFFPPTLTFKLVGNLVCPVVGNATPFSMAVDRRGVAYVLYSDGNLFRVSTATGACAPTPFAVSQGGFTTFGMGFASDFGGAAERLYISQNVTDMNAPNGLGFIDTNTFQLSFLGLFGIDIPRSELTGTGDGRLFAYWPAANGQPGSHISELNKATGSVLAQTDLAFGSSNDAFAFAFWGGDFWIFTGAQLSPTDVSRFRPADGTTTTPTTHPSTIVGAGVSTCAPQL
ncbi:MAG: hypothetical protein QOI41_6642 [Myxococcales bacterium]|jgi:hypothetical protein|nr:hypothetical protein [Myxococcales bacterium]